MTLDEAIAVFDKSADRTRPNAQTEAWAVIRAELCALTDGLITQRQRAEAAEQDARRLDALEIDVAENGPLVLHNGEGTGGSGYRGLGMANTGRMLRQGIDAIATTEQAHVRLVPEGSE